MPKYELTGLRKVVLWERVWFAPIDAENVEEALRIAQNDGYYYEMDTDCVDIESVEFSIDINDWEVKELEN